MFRYPSSSRSSGGTASGFLFGLAAGAALMFFLDPQVGARRRAFVREKSSRYARLADERRQSAIRHASNRMQGAIASMRSRMEPEEIVEDDILLERVRAALGHVFDDQNPLDVRVRCGSVILKGPVREEQVGEIVACVERVRGVLEVDNRLVISDTTATARQGGAPRDPAAASG